MALISVRGLTKHYRMGDSVVHALDGVDLEIERGEFLAIIGPSGSGKSTMMHLLGCLDRPTAGTYAFDGRNVSNISDRQLAAIRNQQIGFVFQTFNLINRTSALDNVSMPLFYARKTNARAPARRALERVGLAKRAGHKPNELSGGERQRVALGRALLGQPKLLVLDEPLSSLDAGHRGEILPYLTGLRDAYSVPMVYVSHTIDEVVRLATHVVLVARGGVVATGPVEEIFSRADLRAHTGRRFEASSIVDATVVAHREDWHLTEVALGRARFAVPAIDAPPGTRLRLRIRARDVALAHREPVDSSITGRLPGHVAEIVPRDGPYAEVRVDVGGASVWALVTRQSVDRMGLAIGMPIWCLVKTVALDNRLVSPAPPP